VSVSDTGSYELRDDLKRTLRRARSQIKAIPTPKAQSWEVEEILEHKLGDHDEVHYLVKWKGFPADQNSWEPQEHFDDYAIIQKYWRRFGIDSSSSASSSSSAPSSSKCPSSRRRRKR
jgi:hypothetical protein